VIVPVVDIGRIVDHHCLEVIVPVVDIEICLNVYRVRISVLIVCMFFSLYEKKVLKQ
jgi:hypothetical protein